MMIWHKQKVIYIIVPGTGSNSFWPGLKTVWGDPEEPTKGNIPGTKTSKIVGEPAWIQARKEGINHFAHLPARLCKELVPEDVWNEYEKIAFVRHPFEWAWTIKNKTGMAGSIGINNRTKSMYVFLQELDKTPYWWFTDADGRVIIDTIYKTEDLNDILFAKFGILKRHANKTHKKKEPLNSESQKLLEEKFHREFEHYKD